MFLSTGRVSGIKRLRTILNQIQLGRAPDPLNDTDGNHDKDCDLVCVTGSHRPDIKNGKNVRSTAPLRQSIKIGDLTLTFTSTVRIRSRKLPVMF